MSQWISVEERLPVDLVDANKHYDEADVLVWDGSQVSVNAFCTGDGDGKGRWYEFEEVGITHWMKLPEPPTDTEDQP